jgi:hypothetical protein
MDRRSTINQIVSKYRGSAHGVVTSSVAPLPVVVGGPTTIRRSRIGTSTIGRGVAVNGIAGGISALRTSKIVTPPVYGSVTTPPVYEVVTTPPKVYEIVTPIIDVTPDTVIQQQDIVQVFFALFRLVDKEDYGQKDKEPAQAVHGGAGFYFVFYY